MTEVVSNALCQRSRKSVSNEGCCETRKRAARRKNGLRRPGARLNVTFLSRAKVAREASTLITPRSHAHRCWLQSPGFLPQIENRRRFQGRETQRQSGQEADGRALLPRRLYRRVHAGDVRPDVRSRR